MQKMENKLMTLFLSTPADTNPAEHLTAEMAEGWLIKTIACSTSTDAARGWAIVALERPAPTNADVLT